ncbi:MAG: transporter [Verrucomicrobia bacterium]|nr:transporter [Verrucomicrobiota bacterium]
MTDRKSGMSSRAWLGGMCWATALLIGFGGGQAHADERKFGYVYEADVLPKGGMEFEQWVTARSGKDGGRYARWDFREEIEYGLTERLTTALYLNFKDEYSSGVRSAHASDEAAPEAATTETTKSEFEFKGFSSEWKYQLASPYKDAVGVVLYFEVGSDLAHETELEQKLILSKNWERWVAAFNLTVEQEWEYEDGETEKEGVLELSAGVSHRFTDHWSGGLELRNHREYADSFEFKNEAHSAFFLGPNVSYGGANRWATLSVLPQIYGDGDTAVDNLILDAHERIEVRLLVGVLL